MNFITLILYEGDWKYIFTGKYIQWHMQLIFFFLNYLLSFLSYTLRFLCSSLYCIFVNSFVGTIWSIFKLIFYEESGLN